MSDDEPDFLTKPTTIAKTTTVNNVRTLNDLETMTPDELLDLLDRVTALLPATKLSEVNLAEELVLQFQRVKAVQAKVIEPGSGVSAQQKAAVVNACGAALQHLVKLQTDLYNAERLKNIEQVLIRVIKDQPEKLQRAFFKQYEQALAALT